MGHLRSLFKVSAIAFIVSQPFFIVPAHAAGFQLNETSPSMQGSAMAGSAAANNDVGALFNNPATLSTLAQNQFYIGGSEILPHVKMTNGRAIHTVNVPGTNPPSSITANVLGVTSQNSVGKSAFVPDTYFGYRINNKFVAGIGVTAPFGLTTKYYGDSVLRFAAVTSSVKIIDINPAIAYQLNDKWSLGAGFQAQFMRAVFSNFNGPYTGIPAIDALIATTHPTYLKADGWGYGYTLGALYKLDPQTRLGIGYRSMISMEINGNGLQYTTPGPVVPAPSIDFPFNAATSANASTKTPAVLTMSAARDINQWTVKATAQLNFWNSFTQLSIYMPQAYGQNSTIYTKWSNAWFGALGADYRYNPLWTFRGGLAFDETPTNNGNRDPRIPDTNRIWANLGASYQLNKNFSFDGAYAHIFMLSQSVNVTQASGSSTTSTVPLEVNQVSARYKGSVDILSVALRYSF